MTRVAYLAIVLLPLVLPACAARNSVPASKDIADARLDIEQCPVHDEDLTENLQMIDWERGSYHPLYYRLRKSLFPCAYSPPSNGDLALVTYCPKCRAAKTKCEADDQCDLLYSAFPTTKAERDQHARAIEAFIARQRRELDEEYARDR